MAATIDVSGISYFLPLISFLLVLTIGFAVLAKTKILGTSKFVHLFVSFLVATIFISVTSAREFIIQITPWFGIFLVALALLLAVIGFAGDVGPLKKGAGVVFVIGLFLVFVFSAISLFVPAEGSAIADWIRTPKIYGALIVLAIGAIISFVLIKLK